MEWSSRVKSWKTASAGIRWPARSPPSGRTESPNRSGGSVRLVYRAVLVRFGQLVFPERDDVTIRVGDHRHYPPRLLSRLRSEAHPTLVQLAAIVQQVRDEQSDPGVPSHQRLGFGVHRRVHADMGLALQELGPERALLGQREAQRVPIKLDGTADIVNENGDAVQRRAEDTGSHFTDSKTRFPTTMPRAITPTSSTRSPAPRSRSTRRLPVLATIGCRRCSSRSARFLVFDFHPTSNRSPSSGISPTMVSSPTLAIIRTRVDLGAPNRAAWKMR